MGMGVVSANIGKKDPKTVLFGVMKDISRTNKMINKDDIWAMVSN